MTITANGAAVRGIVHEYAQQHAKNHADWAAQPIEVRQSTLEPELCPPLWWILLMLPVAVVAVAWARLTGKDIAP